MFEATGEGLIPGLVDGQRLSSVKPCAVLPPALGLVVRIVKGNLHFAEVPTTGGKVVVSLRKEASICVSFTVINPVRCHRNMFTALTVLDRYLRAFGIALSSMQGAASTKLVCWTIKDVPDAVRGLAIFLVNGPVQKRLTFDPWLNLLLVEMTQMLRLRPTGVKRGKKLCLEDEASDRLGQKSLNSC